MEIANELFTVSGSNGLPMAANIHYDSHGKQLPLVLYAHGINGFKDWGGTSQIAQYFAEAGFAFVRFNFSHNGTTPAHPMEFDDLELYGHDSYLKRQYDLEQMLHFLTEGLHQWPVQRDDLHLIGHSRGGTDAILFAADHPEVKKLITWSAPHEATTPWRKWDEAEMKQWATDGVVYLPNKRTGQELPIYHQLYEEYRKHRHDRLDVEGKARQLKTPWLIVHGEADEAVFVDSAYQLKSFQPGAQTAIIPNTGHTYDRSHPWPSDRELPSASLQAVQKSIRFLL